MRGTLNEQLLIDLNCLNLANMQTNQLREGLKKKLGKSGQADRLG